MPGTRVMEYIVLAVAIAVSPGAEAQAPILQWTSLSSGAPGDPVAELAGGFYNRKDNALAVDSQGNTIVIGSAQAGGSLVIKFSSTGVVIWKTTSGRINSHTVVVDQNDDILVSGAKLSGVDGSVLWSTGSGGFLAVDSVGDVFVSRSVYDAQLGLSMRLEKLNGLDGSLLWTISDSDRGNIVATTVDSNDELIVLATEETTMPAGNRPATFKYDGQSGARLWKSAGPVGVYNQGSGIALDVSDNVIVTGSAENQNLWQDYFTAKYSSSTGAELWRATFNGPAGTDDVAQAVVVDSLGDVYVTGSARVEDILFRRLPQYLTIKYNGGNGQVAWTSFYQGTGRLGDSAHSITIDQNGGVVVTGGSEGFLSESVDWATVRYSAATGAEVWNKRFSAEYRKPSTAYIARTAPDGGILVAGDSIDANSDLRVIKYEVATGNELWNSEESPVVLSEALADGGSHRAAAVDHAGNTIVVGKGFNGFDQDFVTAKFSSSGALLWAARYRGPYDGLDSAVSVAVDGTGDVFVTGTSIGANGSNDFLTAKYRGADGSQLWTVRYDGPDQGQDFASDLAIDPAGDVYVTGASQALGSTGTDILTIRYRGSDGTALWSSSYSSPNFGEDIPHAITIGQAGQVLVAGQSQQSPANPDYVTISYNGLNGQIQWAKTYASPDNSQDIARAVTTDLSGDVLVSGESGLDTVTLKYRASDGAELWTSHRLNGEAVRAIATDQSGDAFVLSRPRTGPHQAFEVQKLAAATGSSQWMTPVAAITGRGNHLILGADGNPVVAARMSLAGEPEQFYALKFDSSNGTEIWRVAPGLLAQSLGSAALALASDGSLRIASSVIAESGQRIAVSKLRMNGELFGDGFEQ